MECDSQKYPATIGIESRIKTELIEQVFDESNFMFLGKESANREEPYLLALALGWKTKINAKVERPLSGGFIRTASFSPQMAATINLIRFADSDFNDHSSLLDHKGSYQLAEQYANGGFHLLEGDIETYKDNETYANSLIEEMDEMFSRFFPNTYYHGINF